MSDRVQLEVSESARTEDLAVIDRGLTEFNEAEAPLTSVRPLHIVARDDQGSVIAGLVARTWGLCCEIQMLWVHPAFRRSGVGTRMMRDAEAEAIRRGCDTVMLETFSFQAPEFYEQLGYQTKHRVGGMPDGICKCYMLRRFVP